MYIKNFILKSRVSQKAYIIILICIPPTYYRITKIYLNITFQVFITMKTREDLNLKIFSKLCIIAFFINYAIAFNKFIKSVNITQHHYFI